MNRRFFISASAAALLTACAPAGTITSGTRVPAPSAGMAMVVFYRPAKFAGGAIRFNVNHSSGPVGQLTSGTLLFKEVPPGAQTFWAQAIAQDSITVNAAAGQTYYIRGEVKAGLYAGRPTFRQVPAATALAEIGS